MTWIHDQGPLAWIVVAAYGAGTLFALLAAARSTGRERRFWYIAAVALLFLGFNKQLDLQADLTDYARDAARSEGWYGLRRDVQGIFILIIGLAALGCGMLLWLWLRNSAWSVKAGVIGLVTLLAFIFVRAASFHHIDRWVTFNIAGLRSGWWLELLGIGITAVGAAAAANQRIASPDRFRRRPGSSG
jgi:hypothetical protein